MERHLIEKAYSCAKSNFKKSYFSFKDLYSILLEEVPDIKNEVIDLYVEMLQDIRFISLGKEKWALRENFTTSEINKIRTSMFGLDEYHEEDAYQYMSDIEKNELKSKSEKIEELIIEDEDDNIEKPNIRKLVNEEENEIEKQESNLSVTDTDVIDDNSDEDEEDDVIVDDSDDSSEEDEDFEEETHELKENFYDL